MKQWLVMFRVRPRLRLGALTSDGPYTRRHLVWLNCTPNTNTVVFLFKKGDTLKPTITMEVTFVCWVFFQFKLRYSTQLFCSHSTCTASNCFSKQFVRFGQHEGNSKLSNLIIVIQEKYRSIHSSVLASLSNSLRAMWWSIVMHMVAAP